MTRQEILATAKPILFNTSMVRAILDNRKSVTRRVVKQKVDSILNSECRLKLSDVSDNEFIKKLCLSRYEVGDILYIRETWQHVYDMDDNDQIIDGTGRYIYAASPESWPHFIHWIDQNTGENKDVMPWCPSIHMPKEAARLFLRVTKVRVERLQEISPEQCTKEGMSERQKSVLDKEEYWYWFKELWNSTIKESDISLYGWESNPWVWVIEFERVEEK